MIKRRSLPLAAAAAATWPALLRPHPAAAALPIPPGNVINAKVVRNGSDIGTAKYVFEQSGETLRVNIALDLVIKIGPVPVFRYTHRNVETWQGDTLVSIEAKTDDDGTPRFCRARRNAQGFAVESSRDGNYTAPPSAKGTTYWNINTLTDPLINTEEGHLLNIKMTQVGPRTVPLGGGGEIATREWDMTGDLHVELYYQPDGRWAGMTYYAKDKSVVHYLRY